MSSMTSWGGRPSMVQPTDWAVPRISLMVPDSSLAMERALIMRAMPTISSKVTLPLCLMFLTFFLSRGGSFRALMMRAEAEGTTSIAACLFWMVSLTVILRPFQSPVALAMSSPTFLGDRPRGPILGARAEVAPTSPPVHLMYTILISFGSHLGGMVLSVQSVQLDSVRVSDEPGFGTTENCCTFTV
uniref:Uncharacterized protein n=1 Tax=Anguilla anguilla TaxID=7936 RepID=A0A0E9X7H5_ANGAN